MNTERQMTIELKIMQNKDTTTKIILQPYKFIFLHETRQYRMYIPNSTTIYDNTQTM